MACWKLSQFIDDFTTYKAPFIVGFPIFSHNFHIENLHFVQGFRPGISHGPGGFAAGGRDSAAGSIAEKDEPQGGAWLGEWPGKAGLG